jgi:hypothetical protein
VESCPEELQWRWLRSIIIVVLILLRLIISDIGKQEKIGKKTLDELCDDDKPVHKLKKCTIHSVDSQLTKDDVVVVGGNSSTATEVLVAESSDKDNVVEDAVVEDVVEGDDVDLDDEEQEKTSSASTSKKRGRPIGSTTEKKKAKEELIICCIPKAAVALDEAQQKPYESRRKRLRNGTLTKSFKEIEEKNNLAKGTIQRVRLSDSTAGQS